MATQQGRCTNFGNCDKADSREIQTIPDGAAFKCTNSGCNSPLSPTIEPPPPPIGKIIAALLAIIVIGAIFLVPRLLHHNGTGESGSGTGGGGPGTGGSSVPPPQLRFIKKLDPSQLSAGAGDAVTLNWEVAPEAAPATLTSRVGTGAEKPEPGTLSGASGRVTVKPEPPETVYTLTTGGQNGQPKEQKTVTIHVGYQQGDVLVYYEKTARAWIDKAAAEFDKAHQSENRHLVMDYRGSREGKQEILYNKKETGTSQYHVHPVVWNSADTYWPNKLNIDWRDPKFSHSGDIVDSNATSVAILRTRYVLVMWKDRAQVFEQAMSLPKYQGKTWKLMRDLATEGWQAVGKAEWGKFKMAQSNPVKSSSGMLTLALILEEYRREHPGATPSASGYLQFMRDIEGALTECPETTGKALEAMLKKGRSRVDMAVSYEANAIATVDKGQADIKIIYPAPTIIVNFPCVVLKNAPWVTPEDAAYGQEFIDYLLTREVQQRAPEYGFRPALEATRSVVDEAFETSARAAAGVLPDAAAQSYPSDVNVVNDLTYQWFRSFPQYP